MEFIAKSTHRHTMVVDCSNPSSVDYNCRRKEITFTVDGSTFVLKCYSYTPNKEFSEFIFEPRPNYQIEYAILICNSQSERPESSANDFEIMKQGSEQSNINQRQNHSHNVYSATFCSFAKASIARLAPDNQFSMTIYWIDPKLKKKDFNLSQLMNSSTFSDVDIDVENETINAHKCILCNASPVFMTMLSDSNKIVLTDVSKNSMTALLKFLYQEPDFDKNVVSYIDLCKAANKFEIDDLMNYSFYKGLSSMTEDNCLDFYHFATELNSESLKSIVMNWMKGRRATIVRSNKRKFIDILGMEAGLALIEEIA